MDSEQLQTWQRRRVPYPMHLGAAKTMKEEKRALPPEWLPCPAKPLTVPARIHARLVYF
jgi:hypothetical protein